MRRIALLSVAITFSLMCCMGGVYTPVGSGGPCGNGGRYSINLGVPDRSCCDGVYLEGHVFEFKGQLIVDEYTFWFKDPARIMVANFTDVKCERDRQNPTTCEVTGGAYLVDKGGEGGDLFYVEDVKIRPDNDRAVPAWNYRGEGYITKNPPDGVTVAPASSLRRLEGESQSLSGLLNDTNDAFRNMTFNHPNLDRNRGHVVNQSRELTDIIDASIDLYQDLNASLKAAADESRSLSQVLNSSVADQANNTGGGTEDRAELISQSLVLKGTIQGLNNNSMEGKSDLDNLTRKLESLNKSIMGLMDTSARLNSSIKDLSEDAGDLLGSVDDLTGRAESLSQEINGAVSDADALSTELNESGDSRDVALIGKADNLAESLDGLSDEAGALASDLEDLKSESEKLTGGIEGLKTDREVLSERLRDLTERSTTLTGDINDTIPKCRYVLGWSGPDIICG